jgi:hypothetical protein
MLLGVVGARPGGHCGHSSPIWAPIMMCSETLLIA